MGKRLTKKEAFERMTAYDEAIEAVREWARDQGPSQYEEAQIVIDRINKMAQTWYNRLKI